MPTSKSFTHESTQDGPLPLTWIKFHVPKISFLMWYIICAWPRKCRHITFDNLETFNLKQNSTELTPFVLELDEMPDLICGRIISWDLKTKSIFHACHFSVIKHCWMARFLFSLCWQILARRRHHIWMKELSSAETFQIYF